MLGFVAGGWGPLPSSSTYHTVPVLVLRYLSSTSFQLSLLVLSMPPRAPVVFVDRVTCASAGCNKVPAVKSCMRVMCKGCCEPLVGCCGCLGHDKARGMLEMATATALYQMGSAPHNQFALSRPPAIAPPPPTRSHHPVHAKCTFNTAGTEHGRPLY